MQVSQNPWGYHNSEYRFEINALVLLEQNTSRLIDLF